MAIYTHLRPFGVPGGVYSFTAKSSTVALPAADDFDDHSAGADLDGLTMSDSSHTWATDGASGFEESSGTAIPSAIQSVVLVDNMPDTADVTVAATMGGTLSQGGLIARWTDSSNYYYLRFDTSDRADIRSVTTGDVDTKLYDGLTVSASGSAIEFKVYGSGPATLEVWDDGVLVSTITDSDHSTGKAGMIAKTAAGTTFDLFSAAAYVASGRTTKNSRQWGMNTSPGTRLQYIVGGR